MGLRLLAKTPKTDEAFSGLVVKLVTPFIGGEFVAVEAVFAFSTDNNRLPFKELEADLAAHEALVAGHEGCQVLMEATEPKSVVDHVGVFLGNHGFEALGLLAEADGFEFAVSEVENNGGRGLVKLAGLDSDEPIFDMVDSANTVLAAQLVEGFEEGDAIDGLAVECGRSAPFEIDDDFSGFVGGFGGADGPAEGFFGRLGPWIFKNASLAGATEEVDIEAVGAFHRGFDGDVVLGGVFEGLVAGHFPFADRCDDLEIRSECLEGDIEPDLIVPFTRATMSNRDGTMLTGSIDHQFGDKWSAEGGSEGVFTLVKRACHECGENEVVDEEGTGIHGDSVDGACGQGFLLDAVEVADFAQIDGEGDDIKVVFFLDPGHHDGGVQAAGVSKDDLAFGAGFISLGILRIGSHALVSVPGVKRISRQAGSH